LESVPLEGISSLLFSTQVGVTWLDKLTNISAWYWISISFCFVFSALFSASETALTALNYAKVQHLIAKDEKRYGRFLLWLQRPNRVLTTILIGNNLVNILASALVTSISEKVFGSGGVALAVGGLTLLILIAGEIVPKTFAKHHAQSVAMRLLPLLRIAYLVFLPLTWTLVRIASWVVRIFGGSLTQSGPFVTEEDIEYMINLGTREGVLDEEKEKLLQSILEFDDITIREVMVPRINMAALSIETLPEEVAEFAQQSSHSRIPVYKEQLDNVVGILYLRDLFRSNHNDCDEQDAPDWKDLLRTPYFVPGTMKISDLLREFQRRKSHLAIVVDEFGGTMGLVTLEDILEEIVGEIHDEFDPDEVQDVVEISTGVFHVNAKISLREFGERMDIEFPDDGDYETLGGFLTAFYGKVPQNGEGVHFEGFHFSALDADEKHVLHVEVKVLTEEEKAALELEEDTPSGDTLNASNS